MAWLLLLDVLPSANQFTEWSGYFLYDTGTSEVCFDMVLWLDTLLTTLQSGLGTFVCGISTGEINFGMVFMAG